MQDIYYEVNGSGEAIFLLHGNQENHKIFNQLVEDLKDEYKVIAVDSRYHGKSIKSGELSLNQFAQDVKDVADELALETYSVIGFSDGANIALTLANKDNRMTSAVLMAPNSQPSGIKTFYYFQMWLTLICLLPFCIYNPRARRIFALTRFMLKEPHFTSEELNNIKIPVLLLSGDHDMIKASDIDWISQQLPEATNVIIKNSSHFMLGDQYEKVLKEIRRFYDVITK
ncbi:MAG: alpha/beta hydrolase [Erysipelotrichaceae bacterium]|nr:alpha/beta hydrolase [Erysipelotrichaceae bacterium]